MDLTYSPFAEIPEVKKLGADLSMNISPGERLASVGAGAFLGAMAIGRTAPVKWTFLVLSGALLWRGITGSCPVLKRLDIDRRHAKPGVPGNRGLRIEESIEIRCPADVLFNFWKDLEELPRVMRHLKSVKRIGGKRSHWVVAGPVGVGMEWDAEIINVKHGRSLAWQSLPGASVSNAGSVWFEEQDGDLTRVKVAFEFDPPLGAVGAAIAELLGTSPKADLIEDLVRFKDFAESELVTTAA